jgi:nucleotide-binding universal stress UspA family protein
MQHAKKTTVVTVNGRKDEPADSRPAGADIAAVIARHGVKVEVINIDEATGASIGDALLCHASDLGANLIVMGAYGHARWQELVMGGATRDILKSMTLPVLMSH